MLFSNLIELYPNGGAHISMSTDFICLLTIYQNIIVYGIYITVDYLLFNVLLCISTKLYENSFKSTLHLLASTQNKQLIPRLIFVLQLTEITSL